MQIFHKFTYFKKSLFVKSTDVIRKVFKYLLEKLSTSPWQIPSFLKILIFAGKLKTLPLATNNGQLFSIKWQTHFVEKRLPHTQAGIITVCKPLFQVKMAPREKSSWCSLELHHVSAAPRDRRTQAASKPYMHIPVL